MRPSKESRRRAECIRLERQQLRMSLLAARGPICQRNGCDRPWSEMHEVLTRGRGGSPTDPDNILCLCSDCHRWVTTHEVQAREEGLVRARTAEEHAALFKPWLNH